LAFASRAAEDAPTGSWRTDEYLATRHVILLPSAVQSNTATGEMTRAGQPLQLRVGLYVPPAGPRLPAFINGQPAGDAAVLP
ncbi:MAG: hypothetical protein KDE54_18585, partial [Caldilineaceae bacterium]|nr:hypothetical protein [Caldilineaceae bacterium]